MNPIVTAIQKIWYNEGNIHPLNPFPFVLLCVSAIYRSAVNIRNAMLDLGVIKQKKLPCPVVSIGNITVGGTGKTPTAIKIANILKAKGLRPAILSRGYKGTAKSPVNVVSDGSRILMDFQEAGDEPIVMAQSTEGIPILTGHKRYLTGMYAIENMGADILVLDDGFQHRCLARDIDIVLLHSRLPLGNGFPLPLGPLREPVSALKRADIIIWTGSAAIPDSRSLPFKALKLDFPSFYGYHKPKEVVCGERVDVFAPEYLKDRKVCAFAGIGMPASFRKTLEELGADVADFIAFPDHHLYREDDIARIHGSAKACKADMIVTTEKDGIKLKAFPQFVKVISVLKTEMSIHSPSLVLDNLLMRMLSR
jgi:tetraacyldisaccharide 4'-kinase